MFRREEVDGEGRVVVMCLAGIPGMALEGMVRGETDGLLAR